MSNLVVTGKYLGAAQERTLDNGKKVNSFYLDMTDNPDYPNTPEFGLYGDKCEIVKSFSKGDEVTVTFNINGRKYKTKEGKSGVFTRLQAWKVELTDANPPQQTQQQAQPVAESAADDDLPF